MGAGQRTKHIDTRYLWIPEQVRDEDFSIKKKRIAQILEKRPTVASVLQQHCKFAGLVFYEAMDPTLHYKMKVMKPMMDLVKGLQPRKRQRPDMNTET